MASFSGMCTCGQVLNKSRVFLNRISPSTVTAHRGIHSRKRHIKPLLLQLYNRRIKEGPVPEEPRSSWLNWNFDAELYAFGKRLGEEFTDSTLKKAFTHRSFVEKEQSKIQDSFEGDEGLLDFQSNEDLISSGMTLISDYIKAYLRHHYPSFPEEGISAVHDYLTTDELLAYIALNIGIKDLILSADFPASEETLSKTFQAVVGALAHDQGMERAELFVQDFVLTQLIGKDINEMWSIVNPMGVLVNILQKQERGGPEPRLLFQSGQKSILSVYVVGIYSDKELIGQAPGETPTIAEEMAAVDALKRLFSTEDCRTPLSYGDKGRKLHIDRNSENPKLQNYVELKEVEEASS
ncbi:39S ribosomal protein L44, mitochondrial [Lingula anatina]|uniref:Large ribosomal subunit protein mL44 n=1 Tax=Lingula anatina TaxID=7574 RepID=A0A1S3H0R5_LINAN|nr:39S ribosomal protein L44, mitochondrial [Lingula anatina]|eukprot:XP_013379725.1 39S ribosomal protein L44, mitochondrial [Lingula anatina]